MGEFRRVAFGRRAGFLGSLQEISPSNMVSHQQSSIKPPSQSERVSVHLIVSNNTNQLHSRIPDQTHPTQGDRPREPANDIGGGIQLRRRLSHGRTRWRTNDGEKTRVRKTVDNENILWSEADATEEKEGEEHRFSFQLLRLKRDESDG